MESSATQRWEDVEWEEIEEIQRKSSAYFGLSSFPESLPKDIHGLLQKKQALKAEYKIIQDLKMLSELQKPPEEWLTVQKAEQDLSETKEIVGEINMFLNASTSKVEDGIVSASKVLHTLRAELDVLTEKITLLENEYSQLIQSDSKDSKLQTLQGQLATDLTAKEKIDVLLGVARSEHETLQKRLHRIVSLVKHLQETSTSLHKKEGSCKRECTGLRKQVEEMGQMLGVQCHVKNPRTIELEFFHDKTMKNRTQGEEMDITSSGDVNLTATLSFRERSDKCLELEDVKLNQTFDGAEPIIRRAKKDSDLPRFIEELKASWKLKASLITEIAQLRARHGVDWIPDEGVLRVIVEKSIVCTLKVPSTYPYSGQVTLEDILGSSADIVVQDIEPPANRSLTGWVTHLEQLLGRS